jgi:hypothetical protein
MWMEIESGVLGVLVLALVPVLVLYLLVRCPHFLYTCVKNNGSVLCVQEY